MPRMINSTIIFQNILKLCVLTENIEIKKYSLKSRYFGIVNWYFGFVNAKLSVFTQYEKKQKKKHSKICNGKIKRISAIDNCQISKKCMSRNT